MIVAQLQAEIQHAVRGLFGTQTSQASLPATMPPDFEPDSPRTIAARRRHTDGFPTNAASMSPRPVKRLKTASPSFQQTDDALAIREQLQAEMSYPEEEAANSQSITFSEHSGRTDSQGLPQGSVLNDFINHEPTVMFRDTGDTWVDDASCQERMIADAIAENEVTRNATVTLPPPSDRQPSASFPYSSSTRATQRAPGNDTAGTAYGNEVEPVAEDHAELTVSVDVGRFGPKPSPIVEIQRRDEGSKSPDKQSSHHSKTPNPRKRKSSTSEAPEVDEDDIAIDLPEGKYQPRTSRRRATQATEELVELPRSSKMNSKKRRKTTGDIEPSNESPGHQDSDALMEESASVKIATGDEKRRSSRKQTPESALESIEVAAVITTSESPPNPGSSAKKVKKELPSPTRSAPSRGAVGSMGPPALPPSSNKKVKRSQTTIFEDHLDPESSPRSLSLSQQQALRRSALKDISNKPGKPAARKGRKVLSEDDDDEEDELAKEEFVVEAPPTKRRGRGRPPKVQEKRSSRSAPVVLDDSDEESMDGVADVQSSDEDEVEVPAPKKKKGRGRPPKTTSKAAEDEGKRKNTKKSARKSSEVIEDHGDDEKAAIPEEPAPIEDEAEGEAIAAPTTPRRNSPAAVDPQPCSSNSRKLEPHNPSDKPAKGPTTHSPIRTLKSTTATPTITAVKYRVGLSRRQRIQPLHSTIRRK